MKQKVFCILLAWIVIGVQSVMAQSSLQQTERKQLELQLSKEFSSFHSTHNLNYFYENKTLKQVVNQTICIAPQQFMSYSRCPELRGKTSAKTRQMSNMMGGDGGFSLSEPEVTEEPEVKQEDMYFEVKKVGSKDITVLYQNEEYKISTGDRRFRYLMLKSDRDEILSQIAKLYEEAEQKKKDELKANLAAYQEQIKKFRQGTSGPIAINKEKRQYDGTIPFRVFDMRFIETYLDETFVFKKNALQKEIAKFRKYAETDKQRLEEYNEKIQELESMQNDTIGFFLNTEGKSYDNKSSANKEFFINLRTGQVLSNFHFETMMSRGLLESTTYLNNLAKAKPFKYDGTYSIQELLDSYCFKVKYPQTISDALIGEKVYVLKEKDYEEDEITEINIVPDNKFEIFTKKNGIVGLYRIVGSRWLEKLQAMVGKKVILKNYDDMLYKEDLAGMEVWTVESIEAKEYRELVLGVNLSNGSKKMVINALNDCWLMTHPLNLNNPIKGNGRTALPYDYLVKNAPAMPAEERARRESDRRFFKAFAEGIEGAIKNYDYKKEVKKQKSETHVYQCQYCHDKLKATGKGNDFSSGKCPARSQLQHFWEKID